MISEKLAKALEDAKKAKSVTEISEEFLLRS